MINFKLKELRERNNLSQADIAKLLNVRPATISRYETGVNEPDTKILLWYADHFDVSMDWIFGRVDDPKTIKISPSSDEGLLVYADKNITDDRKALLESPEFAARVRRILQEAQDR